MKEHFQLCEGMAVYCNGDIGKNSVVDNYSTLTHNLVNKKVNISFYEFFAL